MLLDTVFGYVTFCVDDHNAEACINLLHLSSIRAMKPKKSKGYFCFTVRLSKKRKVATLLDKSGIKVYSIRGKGFPFLAKRYRKRVGMLFGAALFCCMMAVSDNYVWQITFSGNENIADVEVEQQLLDAGFGVGSYIPNVDFYSLCNTFLQQSEDFSFISVNMEGTTARVELRERKVKDDSDSVKASNLIAKYSGQIESMTVYTGKSVVEKDSVVKEGELLVSGFLEKTYGFEIVRSTGSIYAYVTRYFEVDIPFEKQVKVYTGKSQRDTDIEFFGNRLKIFSKIDGSIENYDKVTDRERLVLFDKIRLPMILYRTTLKEYTESTLFMTEEEARNEAEMQLSKILEKELADSEVLERKIKTEVTDKSYKLTCEVYCLTDVALEKEILLDDNNT